MAKLIIDHRERHVTRHVTELADIDYQIEQITIGDYAILYDNKIKTIIERKTYEDFAASLKDGRHDNRQKMLHLRQDTGCTIMYIIEGPAYPKPTDYFGNIKFTNIESSIFHMMQRDNIMFVYTSSTIHTAATLTRLVQSLDRMWAKIGGEEIIVPPPAQEQIQDPIQHLKQKQEISPHDYLRAIWACFPGISVEQADEFIKLFTIADIVQRKYTEEQLAKTKLASGKTINKRILKSLWSVDKTTETKILSKIPGISLPAAKMILTGRTLSNILSYEVGAISIIPISAKNTPMGVSKATSIITYLTMH